MIKRLSNTTYKRPKVTYTDNINNDKEAVLDYLNGYEQIEDISKIALKTHIRYFTLEKDGTRKFRLGGTLIKKHKDYIVLVSNNKTWSVQLKNTIFYRKMTIPEVIDLYEDKLEEYEEKINSMDLKMKSLKSLIKHYKKLNDEKDNKIKYYKNLAEEKDTTLIF